jgi:ABC-2 type transport system permease protein
LVRRALIPGVQGFGTFHNSSTIAVFWLLVAQTIALGVLAVAVFRSCDRIARERGLIDRTSNY